MARAHMNYWLTLGARFACGRVSDPTLYDPHGCGHGTFFRTRATKDWG
jgi:hypothetical protein